MVTCAALAFTLLAAAISHLLHNYSRLSFIPGPVLATFSDVWRKNVQRSSGYGQWLFEIHRRYGDVVRLGPTVVSLSDSGDIAQVYRAQILAETSRDQLLDQREVAQFEIAMDEVIYNFIQATRRYRTVDLALSFRFIADELRTRFFSSTRPSSVATRPVDSQNRTQSNSSLFSIIEELLLRGPVTTLKRDRLSCYGLSSEVSAPARANETILQPAAGGYQDDEDEINLPNPVLNANIQSIDRMLIAVFHFLLSNSRVLHRLSREINNLPRFLDRASIPHARDFIGIAYLDAVINETLRLVLLHSGPREFRLQAETSLKSGVVIPRRTTAYWHPYVIQNDNHVFGEDIDTFRPERWTNAGQHQRNLMLESLLPMTACVDEFPKLAAAWLQPKKIVAALLREFYIRLDGDTTQDTPLGIHDHLNPPSMIVEFRSRTPTGRGYVGQIG
ncbi:putative cytochrome P450 monooxygenase [Aspergillus undulatus]|uniref:putative cytochrome P450 monooxygenase n=1 Tax=Aspergillus undulatus TaxID=1810928 RepID=UPI003CCDF2EC